MNRHFKDFDNKDDINPDLKKELVKRGLWCAKHDKPKTLRVDILFKLGRAYSVPVISCKDCDKELSESEEINECR